MFIADNWKDYEVIDTSCKEKLERWGDYLLIRRNITDGKSTAVTITEAPKAEANGNFSDCPSSGVSDTGFRPEKS